MTGSLWCVGVGPGDPELITRKAARLIETADVVAYHRAGHRPSTARAIAARCSSVRRCTSTTCSPSVSTPMSCPG